MDVDKENKEVTRGNHKDVLKTTRANNMNSDIRINTIEEAGDIKEQLYQIQVHTKQSQVDLSELINRLKNNNENLQKLLGSLVQNSNLSKNDVIEIFEDRKLNPRDIIDPIVEELQAVHLDATLTRLLEAILDRLNVEKNTYKWQDEVKQMLVDEKSLLDSLKSIIEANDILLFKRHLSDLIANQKQNITWQEDIKSLLVDLNNTSNVQNTQNDIDELTIKYNELQLKYSNLENKYSQLSKLYTSKFDALQDLQKQYHELIELSQVEIKPNFDSISKLDTLHKATLGQIQLPKSGKKRIVSTPTLNEYDEK